MGLPTAAKRRHLFADQKREQEEDDDDDEDEDEEEEDENKEIDETKQVSSSVNAKIGHFERLLTGASKNSIAINRTVDVDEIDDVYHDVDEVYDQEQEDEEFQGLDTIVEESEEDEQSDAPRGLKTTTSRVCDIVDNEANNNNNDEAPPPAELTSTCNEQNNDDEGDRKSAIKQSEEQTSENNIDQPNDKARRVITTMTQQQSQVLLPSTNRLISEHQVRQRQALFRALAERQKLLDELNPAERQQRADLMSSWRNSSSTERRGSSSGSRKRTRNAAKRAARLSSSNGCLSNLKLSPESRAELDSSRGVPLSAVDLSSVSDRMLDELLGHIASASSSESSISSSASDSSHSEDDSSSESSSSSSFGPHNQADQSSESSPASRRRVSTTTSQQSSARRRAASQSRLVTASASSQRRGEEEDEEEDNTNPSVIGVHEDVDSQFASHKAASTSGGRKCREAHKKARRGRSRSDDDDSDHRDWPPGGRDRRNGGELLAVGGTPTASNSLTNHSSVRSGGEPGPLSPASSHAHQSPSSTASSMTAPEVTQPPAAGNSVEAILGRMLEALHEPEVGAQQRQQEGQEQLSELLERGFLHLEQLLNCRLAPQQQNFPPARSQDDSSSSAVMMSAHKTLLLSKDSDYGSDTQSAECLSHSTASSSSTGPNANTTTDAGGALSPLAIELSFKLAESLRKLAQQQQQQQQRKVQPDSMTTPAVVSTATTSQAPVNQQRARMKSVVMINASGSSSLSRPQSAASSAPADSLQQTTTTLTGTCQSDTNNHDDDDDSPTSRPQSQQSQRQQFKTCVNLNAATSCATSESQINQDNRHQQLPDDDHDHDDSLSGTQIVRVIAAPPQLERRLSRSSFRSASLRRRPSFTGSVGGPREPGAPRPGSPVPRSMLAEVASSAASAQSNNNASIACRENEEQLDGERQQRQLQRALILAQKYNYSPAKLAASKLGSKLQLTKDQNLADVSSRRATTTKRELNGTNQFTTTTNSSVTGQVQFEISYFAKSASLTVHLLQCSQLIAANRRRTSSNPYVKLYLLPDKSKTGKRKSQVKRHQLNPQFDERFTFGPLPMDQFEGRALWLSVWHKDRGLGRKNDFLGELYLPLGQVRAQLLASDLCQSTGVQWYPLSDRMLRNNNINNTLEATQTVVGRNSPKLTTKHLPQSNGHLSLTLARPTGSGQQSAAPRVQQQQAAELVARKLSEFEKKATMLSQQVVASSSVAPPAGPQSTLLSTLGRHKLAPPASSQSNEPAFDTMQVSLGCATGSNGSTKVASGQLFVALKFAPNSSDHHHHNHSTLARRSAQLEGNLHVLIKEARNLRQQDATGSGSGSSEQSPSAYCKCYLLDAFGQRVGKQKTATIKRTDSPRWDHECVYSNLKLAHLASQAIEICLQNRDSILVSESLGSIRLCKRLHSDSDHLSDQQQVKHNNSLNGSIKSGRSNGSGTDAGEASAQLLDSDLCSERESRLWTQMLARPNIWVYGELPLRNLRPLVAATAAAAAANNCEQAVE